MAAVDTTAFAAIGRLSIRTADLTATVVALPLGREGGERGPLRVAATAGEDGVMEEEEGCGAVPSRFVPSVFTSGTPF